MGAILMIVSNSRKFVFVHLPKTAGTSITHALDNTLQWNDVVCGGTEYGEGVGPHYEKRFGLWKHSTAQQIKDVIGDQVWSEYFTFGVVRDPYVRIKSLYSYAEKLVSKAERGWRLKRFMGLQGFWNWGFVRAYLESRSFTEFIRHTDLLASQIAKPMSDYLVGPDGCLLVNFAGRIEHIEDDFQVICERVGLEPSSLKVRNRSEFGTAQLGEYYQEPSDYRFITDFYRRDFELFGYRTISSD